jgi:solute carrier family 8 (sodium/calcium exchanger)
MFFFFITACFSGLPMDQRKILFLCKIKNLFFIIKYIFIFLSPDLKKKILKISKEKDCQLAADWCKSMINHVYFIASNTPEGDSALLKAKWLSLDNHLHNVHAGHGELFPKCTHKRIRKNARRSKKWFEAGM